MNSLPRPGRGSNSPLVQTVEGGGYVVTCVCRWLRWSASHTDADASRTDHTKRCKVARGEVNG